MGFQPIIGKNSKSQGELMIFMSNSHFEIGGRMRDRATAKFNH